MSKRSMAVAGLPLIYLASSYFLTAQAHHSFAMFAQNKCEAVSGTIFKFELKFPHAWLWVLSTDASGKTATWGFEGGEPASLRIIGWSNAVLKKGEKVTVIFNPALDGRTAGFMKRIKLANGQVLQGTEVQLSTEPKDCDFKDVSVDSSSK